MTIFSFLLCRLHPSPCGQLPNRTRLFTSPIEWHSSLKEVSMAHPSGDDDLIHMHDMLRACQLQTLLSYTYTRKLPPNNIKLHHSHRNVSMVTSTSTGNIYLSCFFHKGVRDPVTFLRHCQYNNVITHGTLFFQSGVFHIKHDPVTF